MLVIHNGIVVACDKLLVRKIIVIEGGKIKKIQDESYLSEYIGVDIIDAKGGYILPGLIDIHSDIIKKIIVPRKGLIFDYTLALMEVDKILVNQGITTVFHSLSFANSTVFNQKSTLQVRNIYEIGSTINKTSGLLINHKFHARLELNTTEGVEIVIRMINNNEIHELSFMDHTPGQGQYADINTYEKELRKRNGMRIDTREEDNLHVGRNRSKIGEKELKVLIDLANEKNIPMAYHDVYNVRQLLWMKKNKISICEFPLNLRVAKESLKRGIYTVVGCPNILRGKSHNKNLSAIEAVLKEGANIITSDYFSYGLLHSIFLLSFKYHMPLEEAVSLVTLNPAKALNISDRYGSISPEKFADIIIVKYQNNIPMVRCVIVNGNIVSKLG